MADQKELPSIEYSLKSISWHLKTLADDVHKLREIAEKRESDRMVSDINSRKNNYA